MASAGHAGSRIRERRILNGIKQADLARAAGISASYLNLIEHNRRRIGGGLLATIARELGLEAQALSEGAGRALVADLEDAAAGHAGASAEIAELEDFAGRFPGLARLMAEQGGAVRRLERTVASLSDRLAHDPILSASLHEVLSVVTAMRSTAAILAETRDLDAVWTERFHRNLAEDGDRLAGAAEDLARYLDASSEDAAPAGPLEEVERFLAARNWHIPEIETADAGDASRIAEELSQAKELESAAAQRLAQGHLARAAGDARALPLGLLREALSEGLDPAAVAIRAGCGLGTVLRRIASVPEAGAALLSCDLSGTMILRKPAPGFPAPRLGAACPLWPLFEALLRPGVPIARDIEMDGRPSVRFAAYALAEPSGPPAFGRPPVIEATMLLLPAAEGSGEAALPVGAACRLCTRDACPARREPFIAGSA
ncbi:short-chain fatty acyl-CoA regulator family protein [Roseicyclus sp. F158]|uniref:Short-chain fatty acyl-CoA regulator family protein n=1 Tax=Tropicimonas omnivorans TaxID=3075590 RepID=A0ABU3DI55_9RHOB|nr:short-chain fatty acyl-CoA regulator family protein [Roseicyclus sp. F158]MDT0683393.1 short-chain fatty acyl-CoA regulator family protein [Roseicyclus sp. F158]